tara:strand:- start:2543 stop:3595 length:1053 start_codon:yes stop_codon:yes gene_type:complete
MAYGKDIVSTRKLTDEKKAKLGRNGDTKIGKIDNKKSHVTAWEASLIDSFGKAGEEYVKDVGAGTINPYTGLQEYHITDLHWNPYSEQRTRDERHNERHRSGEVTKDHSISEQKARDEIPADFVPPGGMSRDRFAEVMSEFNIGGDDLMYLTEADPESLQFITDQYDISTGRLDTQEKRVGEGGLSERMLESTRDFALEGADSTLGFQMQGAQSALEDTTKGIGQQFRGGVMALKQGQATQASRSGFAIGDDWGMQQQMKNLTQQMDESTARARRDYDFTARQVGSAHDITRRQTQATYDFGIEDLGFQREGLASDRAQAELTRDEATHAEKKRQTNLLYDEIATINEYK